MSELLKIVQEHLDKTGVSEAEFSRRIGAAPQTVNAWRKRGIKALPAAHHLRGVAAVTDVRYEDVLQAALVDTGYVMTGESRGRRHPGAWELGPELMVRLALAADSVEDYSSQSQSYTDDDDIDDVIATLESLGYAADDLIETATQVAELGVGGKTHLAIAKEQERDRRKAARRAARSVGRRLTPVSTVHRDTDDDSVLRVSDGDNFSNSSTSNPSEEVGDQPVAARQGAGKSQGEQLRDEHAKLGEEPDPEGPEEGA